MIRPELVSLSINSNNNYLLLWNTKHTTKPGLRTLVLLLRSFNLILQQIVLLGSGKTGPGNNNYTAVITSFIISISNV